MKELAVPETTEALKKAFRPQAEEIAATLEGIPLEEFFAPQGTYWSPAEHLRHLVKSVRPLARALRLPKAMLLLRFGPALGKAETATEVRDRYRGLLAAGGTAGRFTPSAR
ncbi:MAG: hypothetical protein KDD47_22050, partial [Acidobacteria bacterium]|nr:hypothetical protein [Acidobacteriota bacterium]